MTGKELAEKHFDELKERPDVFGELIKEMAEFVTRFIGEIEIMIQRFIASNIAEIKGLDRDEFIEYFAHIIDLFVELPVILEFADAWIAKIIITQYVKKQIDILEGGTWQEKLDAYLKR